MVTPSVFLSFHSTLEIWTVSKHLCVFSNAIKWTQKYICCYSKASGVCRIVVSASGVCVLECVCEREGKQRQGEWGEAERDESWLTGQHMARLVFLSVFCLCLWAPCLSQPGRGAAETGSLMRHGRGGGLKEEKQERPRGSNSTAANPPHLFLFHFHNPSAHHVTTLTLLFFFYP